MNKEKSWVSEVAEKSPILLDWLDIAGRFPLLLCQKPFVWRGEEVKRTFQKFCQETVSAKFCIREC